MKQQESLEIYLNHIYDTSLHMLQLWDIRDMHTQMKYGPLIRKIREIEKIIDLIKAEMVEDASNLG